MLLILLLLRYLIVIAPDEIHADICELSDDLNSCYKKFLSFEAIGHIHKYLDNDKNGEVDSEEAAKFVQKEFSATEPGRKSHLLTSEDPLVSLPDLWLMWKKNAAFNWSVKQTVQWLSDSVDLPQYGDIFVRHSVDGKSLPLLALQNMSYLTNVLLIQNPIDKRKIMLKALDTILFGPPQKQYVLFSTKASVITASCGLGVFLAFWFFHHGPAHRLSYANHASSCETERGLKELQKRLDDLEHLRRVVNHWETNSETDPKRPTPPSSKQVIESDMSISADRPSRPVFGNPEDKSEDGDSSVSQPDGTASRALNDPDLLYTRSIGSGLYGASGELALWLQLTYELEVQHYREKKSEAEAQLNAARHACKRLNRKRYNILGSVRLLHTDSLDELEYRLMHSRRVLEQLQSELQERARRWDRIELLTGIPIRSNPGLPHLLTLLGRNSQTVTADQTSSFYLSSVNGGFGIHPIDNVCCRSALDLFHSIGDGAMDPVVTDQGSVVPDSRLHQDSRRTSVSPLETKPVGLPRNYSFVRPFANLWRRKAKCSTTTAK